MSESSTPGGSYDVKACSCGEKMLMLRHERTGFVAPINSEPKPIGMYAIGNIAVNLSRGTYRVVTEAQRDNLSECDQAELRLNHFATCPDRRQYRRRWGTPNRHDAARA